MEYAALALAGNTHLKILTMVKIYHWNGLGVRSPSRKNVGMILANFNVAKVITQVVGGYVE